MITPPKVSSQFQAGPTGPGSAATDTYTLQFTTPPLVNGQTADGKTPDKGQVVATQDGGRLTDPHIVLFTFVGQTSAQFLYENIPNVQTGSTATMLMVATNYNAELGYDIAQATFTDTAADNPVTVSAILQVPGAPSDSQKFSFTGSSTDIYALTFKVPPLSDQQLADGKAKDAGRAIVTKSGNALGNEVVVLVTFTSSSTTTSFDLTQPYVQTGSTTQKLIVLTHNDQESGDTIADAYFTDSKPEQVTLTGKLEAYNVSNTQGFTFTTPPDVYALTFSVPPLANDVLWSDGSDAGRAIITKNGNPLGNEVVLVTFTNSSIWTSFDLTRPYVQTGSTTKKLIVLTYYDQASGNTIADAWFTTGAPYPTVLTGTLEAYNVSSTQDFTFYQPPPA